MSLELSPSAEPPRSRSQASEVDRSLPVVPHAEPDLRRVGSNESAKRQVTDSRPLESDEKLRVRENRKEIEQRERQVEILKANELLQFPLDEDTLRSHELFTEWIPDVREATVRCLSGEDRSTQEAYLRVISAFYSASWNAPVGMREFVSPYNSVEQRLARPDEIRQMAKGCGPEIVASTDKLSRVVEQMAPSDRGVFERIQRAVDQILARDRKVEATENISKRRIPTASFAPEQPKEVSSQEHRNGPFTSIVGHLSKLRKLATRIFRIAIRLMNRDHALRRNNAASPEQFNVETNLFQMRVSRVEPISSRNPSFDVNLKIKPILFPRQLNHLEESIARSAEAKEDMHCYAGIIKLRTRRADDISAIATVLKSWESGYQHVARSGEAQRR